MSSSQKTSAPALLYDGECRFCCLWVERWRELAGRGVRFLRSQDAGEEFSDIPAECFARSVQWIGADGIRREGADAVLHLLARGSGFWKLLLWLYVHLAPFRMVSEGGYRVVAEHRAFFSRLTGILWGRDVRRPVFSLGSMLFLRVLGGVYLMAFVSYGVQLEGLVGEQGILPAGEFFRAAREALGLSAAIHALPGLLWLSPGDTMLWILVWGGALCSVLILLGVLQPLALVGTWLAYLSLVLAGQVFYAFQWDMLLLEAGFLAIFLAPWHLRPGLRPFLPNAVARFLLIWLLFRLMFSAGVVKLASGDPVWAGATALDFHFTTQPLPNPVAWLVAQFPDWLLRVGCIGALGIELLAPLFLWAPARLRHIAAGLLAFLQILIAMSGNYGFFNLLSASLLLLLVQDSAWPSHLRNVAESLRGNASVSWSRWILLPLAPAIVVLSLVPLTSAFRSMPPLLEPLVPAYRSIAPLRSLNGYGLFAQMTVERPEILLEASMDGREWHPYVFRYQPGPVDRMPPVVAPHMPRLDWQMWFAALGDVRQSPWMLPFVQALLEARPEVLSLLDHAPFGKERPVWIRAQLDDYRFSTAEELWKTGEWWVSEPKAVFFQEVRLQDGEQGN